MDQPEILINRYTATQPLFARAFKRNMITSPGFRALQACGFLTLVIGLICYPTFLRLQTLFAFVILLGLGIVVASYVMPSKIARKKADEMSASWTKDGARYEIGIGDCVRITRPEAEKEARYEFDEIARRSETREIDVLHMVDGFIIVIPKNTYTTGDDLQLEIYLSDQSKNL